MTFTLTSKKSGTVVMYVLFMVSTMMIVLTSILYLMTRNLEFVTEASTQNKLTFDAQSTGKKILGLYSANPSSSAVIGQSSGKRDVTLSGFVQNREGYVYLGKTDSILIHPSWYTIDHTVPTQIHITNDTKSLGNLQILMKKMKITNQYVEQSASFELSPGEDMDYTFSLLDKDGERGYILDIIFSSENGALYNLETLQSDESLLDTFLTANITSYQHVKSLSLGQHVSQTVAWMFDLPKKVIGSKTDFENGTRTHLFSSSGARPSISTAFIDDFSIQNVNDWNNVLPNRGFEAGALSFPFQTGAFNGNLSLDNSIKHSGGYSLKHAATGAGSYTYPWNAESLTSFDVDTSFTLTGWAKGSVDGITARVFIFCKNTSGGQTWSEHALTVRQNWSSFSHTYTCPVATSSLAGIRLDNQTSGSTIWWDDLNFSETEGQYKYNDNGTVTLLGGGSSSLQYSETIPGDFDMRVKFPGPASSYSSAFGIYTTINSNTYYAGIQKMNVYRSNGDEDSPQCNSLYVTEASSYVFYNTASPYSSLRAENETSPECSNFPLYKNFDGSKNYILRLVRSGTNLDAYYCNHPTGGDCDELAGASSYWSLINPAQSLSVATTDATVGIFNDTRGDIDIEYFRVNHMTSGNASYELQIPFESRKTVSKIEMEGYMAQNSNFQTLVNDIPQGNSLVFEPHGASCTDLGWDDPSLHGSAAVCGTSKIESQCSGVKSYEQAVDFCSSVGARLCSISELEADEAAETGCDYDDKRIWSSTSCGVNSYYTTAGNSHYTSSVPRECTSKTNTSNVYVRCCADTVPIGGLSTDELNLKLEMSSTSGDLSEIPRVSGIKIYYDE